MIATLPPPTQAPAKETRIAEQCKVVLTTAGIQAEVVALPGYITVDVQMWQNAEDAQAILNLRDDMRYWRFRTFGLTDADRSYVLMFCVLKGG